MRLDRTPPHDERVDVDAEAERLLEAIGELAAQFDVDRDVVVRELVRIVRARTVVELLRSSGRTR